MDNTPEKLARDRFLAEAETLAKLTSHPGWSVYNGLVKELRQDALEQLALCRTQDDLRFWQGFAEGLKQISERPLEIVETGSAILAHEESSTKVIRPEIRSLVGVGVDHEGDV